MFLVSYQFTFDAGMRLLLLLLLNLFYTWMECELWTSIAQQVFHSTSPKTM